MIDFACAAIVPRVKGPLYMYKHSQKKSKVFSTCALKGLCCTSNYNFHLYLKIRFNFRSP